MNVHLRNGTEITDADTKLLRFLRSEYEFYDGVPVAHDSTLALSDILLSNMMNSHLDTATKVQSIWRGRGPVEQALAAIPTHIALEGESVPWDGSMAGRMR